MTRFCLTVSSMLFAGAIFAGEIRPSATADREAVRLSEGVIVTLVVEADAPLRVEPAVGVLDEPSAEIWWARAVGLPKVLTIASGRQRWTQVYRLDPYIPGVLPLAFAPLKVYSGNVRDPAIIDGPRLSIVVNTTLTGSGPGEARPTTGIEPVPGEAPPARSDRWRLLLITAGLAVLGLVLIAVRRWHRPPKPLSQRERAIAELARLDDPAVPAAAFAERLAEAVRDLVDVGPGTTIELIARVPEEHRSRLELILVRCDLAKFANVPIQSDERGELLAAARQPFYRGNERD